MKTIEVFNKLSDGIRNIIRAADIYALHIIAKMRGEPSKEDLIESLMEGHTTSSYALYGASYKDSEIEALKKEEHLKQIGQQILLAAYASLEIYLIEKFKEYYRDILKDRDNSFVENNLKRISFRSLDEIKNNYYELLNIHLPSFDIDYYTTDKCNFKPETTWDAMKLIEKARHDIAHSGESKNYHVVSLLDAYYPFEFVITWVQHFDTNFDSLIYEKQETSLIKEYKIRLAKVSKGSV